jgi:hypothetical protein
MITAWDPGFKERYPRGAVVCDALGRKLHRVVACNLATGEVVIADTRPPLLNRVVGLFCKRPFTTLLAAQAIGGMVTMTPTALVGFGCNYIHRRHGFWPAPLTIVQPTEGERFGFAIERLKHVLGG